MYQNFNKIYRAAIYVRLSKEDGDLSSSAKMESNSISNQKALILDFLKDKKRRHKPHFPGQSPVFPANR